MSNIQLKCEEDVELLKINHNVNSKTTKNIFSYKRLHRNAHKKTAIIVAPGHTTKKFVNNIRMMQQDGAHVFAVKSAKYLQENGVVPNFAVHIDAKKTEVNYVYPHKKTVHFVSTQCDLGVFEKLKNYKTYSFNSRTSGEWHPQGVVAAGSNTTLQAMFVAKFLGYKNLYLIGFDCSWPHGETTHTNENRPKTADQQQINVKLKDGRVVTTNPVLIGATQEACALLHHFGNDMTINLLGDMFAQEFMLSYQAGEIDVHGNPIARPERPEAMYTPVITEDFLFLKT